MSESNGEVAVEVLSPGQKLTWCVENLGQRLTTAGLGFSDARCVNDWAVSQEVPERVQEQLDLLHGAASSVATEYDAQTARAFVRSANPQADGRAIIQITGDARTAAKAEVARSVVTQAVEAFLG